MSSARGVIAERRQSSSAVLALIGVVALGFLAACTTPSSTDPTTGVDSASPAPDSSKPPLIANNPQPRESLRTGGQLALRTATLVPQWNPFHARFDADAAYIVSATDPMLYRYTADGAVSPRSEFLAAMPAETLRDGKQVFTYRLNPRAAWNDGTPIDYRSFEAVRKVNALPLKTGRYENVATAGYEDIEAITAGANASEVIVTMRAGQTFYPITELFTSLLHPAAAESPEVFNKGFIDNFHPEWRAGPFTLESLNTTNKTLTLVRNPKWWGRPPLLDRISFQQMEESATVPAFKARELDAISISSASRYAQVQAGDDVDIRRGQRLSTWVLIFNSAKPPFSEVAVRKAMWQVIDRDQWNLVRFKGMDWSSKPINSAMYFSFQPQAQNNMPRIALGAAEAKKTLEAAGYRRGSDGIYAKDGRRLSVPFTYFGDDPLSTSLAQTLRNQSASAGIEISLDNRPMSSFEAATAARDFMFVAMGWQVASPTPVMSVCQAMCTNGVANLSGTGSAALDERIRGVGAIKDPARQSAEINAVEKEWLTGFGQLPMTNGPDLWAYRPGVANLGPAGFSGLQPIWEDIGWMADNAQG